MEVLTIKNLPKVKYGIVRISSNQNDSCYVLDTDLARYAGITLASLRNLVTKHKKELEYIHDYREHINRQGQPKKRQLFTFRQAAILLANNRRSNVRTGLANMFDYVLKLKSNQRLSRADRLDTDKQLNDAISQNAALKHNGHEYSTQFQLINKRVTGMNNNQQAAFKRQHGSIIDNMTPLQHAQAKMLATVMTGLNLASYSYDQIKQQINEIDLGNVALPAEKLLKASPAAGPKQTGKMLPMLV